MFLLYQNWRGTGAGFRRRHGSSLSPWIRVWPQEKRDGVTNENGEEWTSLLRRPANATDRLCYTVYMTSNLYIPRLHDEAGSTSWLY